MAVTSQAGPRMRFSRLRHLPALVFLACTDQASAPELALNTNPAAAHARSKPYDYDIVIRGGSVIDGTGAARARADVGLRGDTIASIGNLSAVSARTTIDAPGLVVAPGFIDLLGQSEGSVLIDPHLEGKVRQGVTTEVTGEGRSPGPLNDAMIAERNQTRPPGYPEVTWRTLGEYMRFLEKRGSAINFAFYVGATNAREIVLGNANRQPNQSEIKLMEALIDQAMKDGAIGLSSALIYVPAVYASRDELTRLARVAGRHGGGYWTHLRNEADRINEALDEAFQIARDAGVPLNIFHLKVGGKRNWGRMPGIVKKIEKEQERGLDVASNVYPYTATATGLTSLAPSWALEGGYAAFLKRLKDPATRTRIVNEIESSDFYQRIGGATGVLVRRIPNPEFAKYERKRLSEIAVMMSVSPGEAAARLFESSNASPTAIYFSMSEGDVKVAAKQSWTAIGSDSGAVVGEMKKAGAHPRAYGTFARMLGPYVRDDKLYTLEEGIRKATSLAASRAGFKDRGVLKAGMKADIVVFNPATIRDRSTYEDPHHFSEGISDVIVNGTPVLREGKMTDALPGRVLRRNSGS